MRPGREKVLHKPWSTGDGLSKHALSTHSVQALCWALEMQRTGAALQGPIRLGGETDLHRMNPRGCGEEIRWLHGEVAGGY